MKSFDVVLDLHNLGEQNLLRVAYEYFRANPGINYIVVFQRDEDWAGYRRNLTLWNSPYMKARGIFQADAPDGFSGEVKMAGPLLSPYCNWKAA